MKDFEPILAEYSNDRYSMYSRAISKSDWGDFGAAENYLDKYWLSKTEYEKKWKATQNSIFTSAQAGLSEMVFQSGFDWFVIKEAAYL